MGDRRRTSYLIRALAGVYLVYLGYTLLRGLFTGAEDYNIIFAVCGVVFIVVGIGLVISCLRYMKSEAAQQTMIEESGDDEEASGEDAGMAESADADGDTAEAGEIQDEGSNVKDQEEENASEEAVN